MTAHYLYVKGLPSFYYMGKNEQIAQTYAATIRKRATQRCRVFKAKFQWNKLNKAQRESLSMLFIEAKWLYNHVLSLSNDGADVFSLKYNDIQTVTHYSKDKEKVETPLRFLSSQMRQSVLDGITANIKALSRRKKNGGKVGRLKFLSDCHSVSLKQHNVSYKIVGGNRVKIQGIAKPMRVNGLGQLSRLGNYELANAKLIHDCDGYFIAFTVYTDKEQCIGKPTIGVDFGCQTSLTLSDGRKFNCVVEETEQAKRLKRRRSKAKKGSNNYRKLTRRIMRMEARSVRKRNDAANKICSMLDGYKVVMQDEQITKWKHRHGKKVQHGILGRVKQRLMRRTDTVVLSKWTPTTKLCAKCGNTVDIPLWERTFHCPQCGHTEDRDVHAANNMLWFYKNNIGVGRTESKPSDIKAAINGSFDGTKTEAAVSSVQR